jgi:hypothetical protein
MRGRLKGEMSRGLCPARPSTVWTTSHRNRPVVTRECERRVRTVEGATLEAQRGEPDEPLTFAARQEKPAWQEKPWVSRDGRGYTWLADYLARLEGKEARGGYYAWLE